MEQRLFKVLLCMQDKIDEEQLKELKSVLFMVFDGVEIVEERHDIAVVQSSWQDDLGNYLMSKALEGIAPSTIDRYRYELSRLLSYINKSVTDILARDISGYMRIYKSIRKISNQTLKNVRAIYNSFFIWLRDHNIINTNPMLLVEGIKVETKIRRPFSDEEREMLLRSCKTLRDQAIMEFLYSTAMRVSELSKLNRDDINFSNRDLIVYGKGNKERTVYINERANLYLKEYLRSRTDDNPALFVSLRNPKKRLSKNGIEAMVKKVGKIAGVAKSHPHRFRRTALTNALNRGMPLQEAMILAGHSKPETTLMYCTISQDGVKYHHNKYLSA